jgi:hypothetical protein
LKVPGYMRVGLSQTTLTGEFHYKIWNYGKTPARVCALKMRFELGSSRNTPPNPFEVFGIPNFLVNPHIIPQGIVREHQEHLFPNGSFTDDEDGRLVKALDTFLWAYGFVRYADVHGGYYETRICYRYNVTTEDLQMDGPPEYNQAT